MPPRRPFTPPPAARHARRPGRVPVAAARVARSARQAAGWAYAWVRLPAPPPPLASPPGETVAAELRRLRATRPGWQRAGFVAVLALLLALLLGPDRVMGPLVALAMVALLWPVLGWPGRVAGATIAVALAVALLRWQTIPVVGLVGFARWFLTSPPAAAHHAGGPLGALPSPPGSPPPGGAPARAGDLDGLQAGWAEAARAAGLAGATLHDLASNPYGWTATVVLRAGQTLSDALRQRQALESALTARPGSVRLEQNPHSARQVYLRVVQRDPHAQAIPWAGPTAGSILEPITLGLWETGDPVTVHLAHHHTLIVGTTGSGKSVLLNALVAEFATARDVVVWGVDFTGGAELSPWADAGCLGRVATTAAQAEALLLAAKAVVDTRLEALAREGVRTWTPSPAAPALKLVFDEYAELVRQGATMAKDAVDSIAERGRKVAVTLVVSSLRATMEVLGSDTLRAMLTVRICLGVEDPAELPLAFGLRPTDRGRWDPVLLDAPGKFFLQARAQAQTTPRPARAAWIPVEQVRQVAAHAARQPTPLDELSARAGRPPPPAHPARRPAQGGGGPQPSRAHHRHQPLPTHPGLGGTPPRRLRGGRVATTAGRGDRQPRGQPAACGRRHRRPGRDHRPRTGRSDRAGQDLGLRPARRPRPRRPGRTVRPRPPSIHPHGDPPVTGPQQGFCGSGPVHARWPSQPRIPRNPRNPRNSAHATCRPARRR